MSSEILRSQITNEREEDLPGPSSSSFGQYLEDGRTLRPRLQDVEYGEVDEMEYLTDDDEPGCLNNQKRIFNSQSTSDDRFSGFSESCDDGEEEEKTIMIGEDYQAVIPEMLSEEDRQTDLNEADTSICTWMPPEKLSDEKVDKYVKLALEGGGDDYPYTVEQVLGMLYCSDYRTSVALRALQEYSPESDGWTFEEKIVFEQALDKHGKNFKRIVEDMFPEKSVGSVIKRYYERKVWTMSKNKKEVKVAAESSQEAKKAGAKSTQSASKSTAGVRSTGVKSIEGFASSESVTKSTASVSRSVENGGSSMIKFKQKTFLGELAPKIRQNLMQKVHKMLWEKRKETPVVITIDDD